MRRLLVLGLTVIGVQLGCGGDAAETDMEMRSNSTSQELLPLICQTDHVIVFYSDSTLTTAVGHERCYCNRTPTLTGRRTPYSETTFLEQCL
jgi:hypothetical protein